MCVRLTSSRSRTSIEPDVVVLARVGQQPACLVVLLLVDGAERAVGEEAVAAQAGVGVRAGLDERQAAVAVGQRLLGAGDALLHPRRLLQRPVDRQRDPFAADVDALMPAA